MISLDSRAPSSNSLLWVPNDSVAIRLLSGADLITIALEADDWPLMRGPSLALLGLVYTAAHGQSSAEV